MRKLLQFGVLLGFLSVSFTQPAISQSQKIKEIVKPDKGIQVTNRIIFLFDCSTSMGEDKRFARGMSNLKLILTQPIDSGMFSIIGFNSSSWPEVHNLEIWKGVKEKNIPKGWASLPSLDNVKKATKWLDGIECYQYTDMYSVIEKAFKLNKGRDKLTIILFSDGNNTWPNWKGEKPSSVRKRIEKLQKERVKQGKGEITIFVFGVGVNQNRVMLSQIARAGHGGYYTSAKVCKICFANKRDIAEIQQEHEDKHVKPSPKPKQAPNIPSPF